MTPQSYTIPDEKQEKEIRSYNGYIFKYGALHCRPKDLWTISETEKFPERWRIPIELYLANFCKPIKTIANEVRCVACGTKMSAPQGGYLGANRGLVLDENSYSLEGRCGECAYPVRYRHTIFADTGTNKVQLLVKLDFFPMSYHPSALMNKSVVL